MSARSSPRPPRPEALDSRCTWRTKASCYTRLSNSGSIQPNLHPRPIKLFSVSNRSALRCLDTRWLVFLPGPKVTSPAFPFSVAVSVGYGKGQASTILTIENLVDPQYSTGITTIHSFQTDGTFEPLPPSAIFGGPRPLPRLLPSPFFLIGFIHVGGYIYHWIWARVVYTLLFVWAVYRKPPL